MSAFPLRMAWRETRAAWRHFLYFFLCIALGVGALVGVSLFAAGLEQTVVREARSVLGGDIEVRTSRPMSARGLAVLDSLAGREIAWLHVSELHAMAAAGAGESEGRQTQIVELKAVPPGYPVYGHVVTVPAAPLGTLLERREPGCAGGPCWGAVVQQSLLIRMGLSVGEVLRIGQARFRITGLVTKEPDRVANAFTLGPRVIISREALAATDLIQPGSRVHERYLLSLPDTLSPGPLVGELRGRLAGESARVTTYRTAQPRLKRFLDQLARYFGLIGLTALFVGGIGIASTVQAFIREKLQTIAVLKTLGAESSVIMRTYLVQAMALGLVGSLVGAGLGLGLQAVLPPLANRLFPTPLLEAMTVSSFVTVPAVLAVAKGIALGLLTTLLFTLWPLLGVREVRPALVFRRDVTAGPAVPTDAVPARGLGPRWRALRRDRLRTRTALGLVLALALLAIWQAGSLTVGLLFLLALLGAVLLLSGAAAVVVRVLARRAAPRSLVWRQAVRNVHRPGSQTAGVMVAIGIGVMVIVAVAIMERSLIRHLGESRPSDAPTFFFIDIQPDQGAGFAQLLRERAGREPEMTPLVHSRLHAVDGTPVAVNEADRAGRGRPDGRARWYRTRQYRLTFLEQLPKDNEVVAGAWWPAGSAPAEAQVSVEEEAARHLGLEVGSTVSFEIQGAVVDAVVSSIRRVDWSNFSTNFYMILSPGALDGAPFTYVATIRVPRDDEVSLQQAVVAAFPNVTAINIGEVLDTFARILDRLSLAIRSVAGFCIVAGAVVMATALAATRYQRVYESAILKALGSTRGFLARAFAAEYALLGGAAGLLGIGLGAALAWGVLTFFLDVPWAFTPGVWLAGFVATVLVAVGVGFLSTFSILGQRPLPVLRRE